MKRLLILLCTISVCIYLSCTSPEEEARKRRMQRADDDAYLHALRSLQNWPGASAPGGQSTIQASARGIAAAASQKAGAAAAAGGDYVIYPADQINPNIRVSNEFILEFNPYEVEGEMHNVALDFIVRKKLDGMDVLNKFMERDRETIDKFLKLNPEFKDDNVRKDAVDAFVAAEIPEGLKESLIKITYAKDDEEAMSYLDLSHGAKALVTEVHATCNEYYLKEADFKEVAGYLNDKITFLLKKGKDITTEDQQLAAMFTVLKHSYYYWYGTK